MQAQEKIMFSVQLKVSDTKTEK